MEALFDFLTGLGKDYAFTAIMLFGVLYFLNKVLTPVFNRTADIFKEYLKVIVEMKGLMEEGIKEITEARRALQDIAKNTDRRREPRD